MKPDTWKRIEELWDRASKLSGVELEALLTGVDDPAVVVELRSMLAHARDDSFLEQPVLAAEPEADPLIGAVLGPYRVIERIGQGGMGRVYLAERVDEHFHLQVAIKVLRASPRRDLTAYFLAERQILADLDHAHIARLLDGGTTPDGQPYVVMEHIRGEPITGFCRRRRLGIRERLGLFRQLCDAVHDAHRHLVVHRDLKPSNVLVTEAGEIKLLDFGIAKLLRDGGLAQGSTLEGQVPEAPAAAGLGPDVGVREAATADAGDSGRTLQALTPSYASPEQLRGEVVTTASDVYSLGVLLFELLAGRRPFDGGEHEDGSTAAARRQPPMASDAARKAPGGGLPMSPKRLGQRLRGDLDAIAAKALEPRPEDRYASARALSEDIGRHLDELPVAARPATTSYRLGKLLRRHPVAAPLVSALALALVVLAVYAALLARRSLAERDEARHQRAQAEEVMRFLEEAFRAPDPNLGPGDKIRAKDLLDRETERVLREFPGRPDLRARLLGTLAEVYLNLGLFDEAGENFERCLALRLELYGEHHPEVAATRNGLAWMAIQQGRYPEALEQLEAALAILDEQAPGDDLLRADALERRGMAKVALGRFAEGEADHREALAIRLRGLGEGDEAVGQSWSNLAESLGYQGRYQEAQELAKKALAVAEATRGRDSVAGATALFVLADQRYSLGDLQGAVEAYDESLAIYRRRVSETHPSVAILLNNRARALRMLGDFGPAEASYRQALEIIRSTLGNGHREEATVLGNLAQVLRKRGRFEEAFEMTLRAQAFDRELLGTDHVIEGVNLNRLGSILRDWGKLEAAAEVYRRAVAVLEALGDDGASSSAYAVAGLARTRLEQGRVVEARELFERALSQVETTAGAGSPRLADARIDLGDALRAGGELEAAESEYRGALESLPEVSGTWFERAQAWRRLAEVRLLRGRAEEAAEAAGRALGLLAAERPPGHWQLAEVRIVAAAAETALGRGATPKAEVEVEAQVAADFETLRTELGETSPATRDALEWVVRYHEAAGSPAAARYRRLRDELLAQRRALAGSPVDLPGAVSGPL